MGAAAGWTSGAGRYRWVWIAVVPLALWTVVRLIGMEAGFPLVPLMAFTPYAAIAALFVAGVALALRNWAAATVAALATACLAAVVLPRAIGDGLADAAGRETLGVLSANVHFGTADAGKLVALVDRFEPDVLAVQELTPSFARELRAAGLPRRLPHAIESTRRRASGAGIYSRLPLRELPEAEVFAFRQPRAELTLRDGRPVRLVDVHPYPPTRGNADIWEAALETMPVTGAGVPWVLAGDFNATLDHAELREVLDDGYRDAGDVAGEGLEPTWPAEGWKGRAPGVTIDHVLADRRLGVADYEVADFPGTDHRAVWAQLVMP